MLICITLIATQQVMSKLVCNLSVFTCATFSSTNGYLGSELQVGFLDVAFLPSRVSFYTMFICMALIATQQVMSKLVCNLSVFTYATFSSTNGYLGSELQVGFQDVAFLPSELVFVPCFLKNCGRGEGLMAATCHRTIDGGKQGHAPCKSLLLQ